MENYKRFESEPKSVEEIWISIFQEFGYTVKSAGLIKHGGIELKGFDFIVSGLTESGDIPVLVSRYHDLSSINSISSENNTLILNLMRMVNEPVPEFRYIILADWVIPDSGQILAGLVIKITKNPESIKSRKLRIMKNFLPISEYEIKKIWNRNMIF